MHIGINNSRGSILFWIIHSLGMIRALCISIIQYSWCLYFIISQRKKMLIPKSCNDYFVPNLCSLIDNGIVFYIRAGVELEF